MRKITIMGDMTFTKADLIDNRECLIKLRDEALKQNAFDYTIVLSHTIAIMAKVIEEYEG